MEKTCGLSASLELVISIFKLTMLPPSLAVDTCKGSILSSIKRLFFDNQMRLSLLQLTVADICVLHTVHATGPKQWTEVMSLRQLASWATSSAPMANWCDSWLNQHKSACFCLVNLQSSCKAMVSRIVFVCEL